MAKRRASKNANGQGTVYKRTRNSKTLYYAELTIGYDANGKPIRHRSAGFTTKREAEDWLTKKKQDRNDGNLPEPTRQPLGAFMREWIETTAVHEVSPSTLQLYRNMLNWYIDPQLGKVELRKLRPQLIQAMYHRLIEVGKSPRTVQLVHAVLRRCLAQAVDWDLLAKNPAEQVRPPKAEAPKIRALGPTEIVRFIEAAKSDRLHALFILAATTGLRRGELLGLRWQDVDLKAGTITVTQTQKKIGETITFGPTKTKASQRLVVLPDIALESLNRWRIEQAEERLAIGEAWAHPELVFTTAIGTPVHPKNMLDRNFKRVLEAAGLPRIRFHDLRHSAATLMLAQGVNPKVLQEVLGHSQIQVTLNIYAHVLREQKKEAAQKVNDFLKAAQSQAR